ncbi:transposase [Mycetohabitans endofungorum]|uniref:transposase n=2 Tax=Burkholderiaceae TaxID=119060 RepID=UPI002FCE0BCE
MESTIASRPMRHTTPLGWYRSIPYGLHRHFEPLTTAFQNWMPEILAYFDRPVTNAYMESLNNRSA